MFNVDPIIEQLRYDLHANSDEAVQNGAKRFFKEEIYCYGVKSAIVGKIAKKYWAKVKVRDKQEIFNLCEELYSSGYLEEAFVVSNWMAAMSDHLTPADLPVIRYWISTYITN